MSAPTLYYSREKLFHLGFVSFLLGFGSLPIGWQLSGKEGLELLHAAYLLYAFGPNGPRVFVLSSGLLFGLAGLAALVRAAGDRARRQSGSTDCGSSGCCVRASSRGDIWNR
jgi:hypothetical protein